MKRLFSAIVMTACAVGLMPLSASADDDDWEEYLEDLREDEEERREDYEDWLEDQRERQHKYWKRYGRFVPVQPAYPPPQAQYYYGTPNPGLNHEGTFVYPQPQSYRTYTVPQNAVPQNAVPQNTVPQNVRPTPHMLPVPEALPTPGVPMTPRLVPPLNGRTIREF